MGIPPVKKRCEGRGKGSEAVSFFGFGGVFANGFRKIGKGEEGREAGLFLFSALAAFLLKSFRKIGKRKNLSTFSSLSAESFHFKRRKSKETLKAAPLFPLPYH